MILALKLSADSEELLRRIHLRFIIKTTTFQFLPDFTDWHLFGRLACAKKLPWKISPVTRRARRTNTPHLCCRLLMLISWKEPTGKNLQKHTKETTTVKPGSPNASTFRVSPTGRIKVPAASYSATVSSTPFV